MKGSWIKFFNFLSVEWLDVCLLKKVILLIFGTVLVLFTTGFDEWIQNVIFYFIHISFSNSDSRYNLDDAPVDRTCPYCHKIFDYPVYLTRHLPIHTGERAFACSSCGKRFHYKSNLIEHMKKYCKGAPGS